MSTNETEPLKWSLAVCQKSGKISEIMTGHVPLWTMLPPCSSNDLPVWIHVIEISALEQAQKRVAELEADLKLQHERYSKRFESQLNELATKSAQLEKCKEGLRKISKAELGRYHEPGTAMFAEDIAMGILKEMGE